MMTYVEHMLDFRDLPSGTLLVSVTTAWSNDTAGHNPRRLDWDEPVAFLGMVDMVLVSVLAYDGVRIINPLSTYCRFEVMSPDMT